MIVSWTTFFGTPNFLFSVHEIHRKHVKYIQETQTSSIKFSPLFIRYILVRYNIDDAVKLVSVNLGDLKVELVKP